MSDTSDEDHDTSYEVETVLDDKGEEGNKTFLVKCVGYPVLTWEPEGNLAHARLRITGFRRSRTCAKKRRLRVRKFKPKR